MRSDGRLPNGTRKIKIIPGYLRHPEGSCLIEIGNTRVICTASVEDGVPHFLRGRGTGWITAEYGMLPRSCAQRVSRESTKGKKDGRTHEIQRLVGRSMRITTDMTLLGERTIWIDCDVIEADGGTRCASITGSFVALAFAMAKLKKSGKIDSIPINSFVSAISVGKVKGKIYLDLTYEEDSNADVDMNFVMTDSGKLVEVQGTAEKEAFTADEMTKMYHMALSGIKTLISKQKSALKGVLR